MPAAESTLLLLLRHGDEKAFQQLFVTYSPRVFQFAMRFLKSREQAEEAVQETFISLWINRSKVDPVRPLAPYLFTIAKHITLNMLRQMSHPRNLDSIWNNVRHSHHDTDERVLVDDLQRSAHDTLCQLPQQQQAVFRMSRYEGLNYDEIAERLHISPNTVRNHLVQALKNMRRVLKSRDVFLLSILIWS